MSSTPRFGSRDLRLPDDLRAPLLAHLADLREKYIQRNWAGRVGFGQRPALIVIDLALFWTRPDTQMGSSVDSVVEAACQVLESARAAGIPIFFTTYDFDPADPPSPHHKKLCLSLKPGDEHLLELDPRLKRRPTEKLIRKKYASAFKGTNLHEMLAGLVDRHADRDRPEHQPLRLRHLPRRHQQFPRHRPARGRRRALRDHARSEPARHRHRPGRRDAHERRAGAPRQHQTRLVFLACNPSRRQAALLDTLANSDRKRKMQSDATD